MAEPHHRDAGFESAMAERGFTFTLSVHSSDRGGLRSSDSYVGRGVTEGVDVLVTGVYPPDTELPLADKKPAYFDISMGRNGCPCSVDSVHRLADVPSVVDSGLEYLSKLLRA